ncbi:MAG: glycogen/starch synthase [Bacteroidales bacterium]|nr:glycogen/starch synthase [Candidatus Sodaliphilus limicaballi]
MTNPDFFCNFANNFERVYMLDYLFETSWEVCNKVGGIYAVLSTKAHTLQQLYKDKVIFIGPDLWKEGNESSYFIERKTLMASWRKKPCLPFGIKVRVGRWNVPGSPIAILVDYKDLFASKDLFYGKMWELYGVDSLHAYGDYDESCMFGLASAMVIESIVNWSKPKGKVIAHFNEWTTGMGLLYVKHHLPTVATVFTTHATSIGRSICGNGKPLYDYMAGYNGDQMAGELNMQSKHSLEKAAAHQADSFTTVSEVTARESMQLLERAPFVTPNAFEQNFVPAGKKFTQVRAAARKKLLDVARALTGVRLGDDTMLVATSGRCEFRNKGIDAYLDAVNVLRSKVNNDGKRHVVAFVLVPAWVDVPREDLLNAMQRDNDSEQMPKPVITHTLHNHGADPIENKVLQLGFNGSKQDKVFVVYIPSYLNGTDGVLNMAYYDVLAGLDLTVFPSYYEPWGYTPMESSAFAVPTITTDLAGYGQWILDTYGNDSSKSGVQVIHRTDSNYDETVHSIANSMYSFYQKPCDEVKALKEAAQNVAKQASWENFISYYLDAYKHAVERK